MDANLAVQLFADQANKYIDAIERSKHHRIDTNKLRECLDSAITKVIQDRAPAETSQRPVKVKEERTVETDPKATALLAEGAAFTAITLYEYLPIVDPWTDPNIWAIPDGGCNSSCHSRAWRGNAMEKLARMGCGYTGHLEDQTTKTFSRLGSNKSTCVGRYR